MSDSADRPRLYGEKEVARILERASEIHVSEGGDPSTRGGLTLAELEEIAAEAGIPRTSLRQAVVELEQGGRRGGASALIGESPTIVLERTVPVTLPPEAFEALIVEIQRAAGMHGQGGLLGRTLTWQADTPTRSRSLQVMITTRSGETRIRVEERLHQLAGGLFGGLMGGVGGGLGIGVGVGVGLEVLGSALVAVAWPVGVMGAAYLTARTIFSSVARKRQRELRRLVDVLIEVVEESGVAARRLDDGGPAGSLPGSHSS